MKTRIVETEQNTKIISPVIMAILLTIGITYMHLSYTNDVRAGVENKSIYANIDKFITENVVLF